MTPQQLSAFRRRVRAWYERHRRELPWRGTKDPYRIWVSEIMLQQTTTKTVEGYFERFMTRFPTIADLAAANLEQVNRLWEGLGYYRRAAQLHKAALVVVERFGGVFPTRYEDVLALPGVGRYTAGAILSIAFDRRLPILEANTIRLHARLLALKADPTQGEANTALWKFAETILPKKDVGHFNQALMDIGSRVCTPRLPDCPNCPILSFCRTAALGLQGEIPYPKAKPIKEDRVEVAAIIRKNGKILMIQYPPGVRWAGLWDFPRCDVPEASLENAAEHFAGNRKLAERLARMTGRSIELGTVLDSVKHAVTRFRITLFFCEAHDRGPTCGDLQSSYTRRWVFPEGLSSLPLNSTARRFADKHL